MIICNYFYCYCYCYCVRNLILLLLLSINIIEEWMNMPEHITNCPAGLGYLTTVDQLLIKKDINVYAEYNNKSERYVIKNTTGQLMYYAIRKTECLNRILCQPSHVFNLKVYDSFHKVVISVHRPSSCTDYLFPCCTQPLEVCSPPDTVVGIIEQQWTLCLPMFIIKNTSGEPVFCVAGATCSRHTCNEIDFNVSESITRLFFLLLN